MKKFIKGLLLAVIVIVGGGYGYMVYNTDKNRAVPGPAALAALQSSAAVSVTDGDWLIMEPKNVTPTTGVIFYTGANCDVHGYAEIFQRVAAAGYLVVAPTWIFDYSITDIFRSTPKADEIRAAYPDIKNWVIAGHSMGGATAGIYAHANQDRLAGIIFYDSYPPDAQSLGDSDLPALHVHRATLEGEAPAMFTGRKNLYPANTTWVPVPGGIHMYFGSFIGGGYKEVWEPKISNAAQVDITTAATIDFLGRLQ